ncbi:MAG TPA: DUF6531 domain-containing protein, partial [Steroidobacteraceae bacterium]
MINQSPIAHRTLMRFAIALLWLLCTLACSESYAQTSCSVTPAAPIYQCVGGLCVGASGCPATGTVAEFKACSENYWYNVPTFHGILASLFGSLTFDYEQVPSPQGVDLWWTSQGNGNYVSGLTLVAAGVDCPQSERNAGRKSCPAQGGPVIADPVNSSTGNQFEDEADYQDFGSFPLSFHRYYNSATQGDRSLGVRWTHSFSRLLIQQSGTEVKLLRDDGEILYFERCGTLWCASADETGSLTQATNSSGYIVSWQFTDENDTVEQYNGVGQLVSETSRSGLAHTIVYDTSGRLGAISDSFGHKLSLVYDASNRIQQITEPGGGTVIYAYDASGNLSTTTYPDSAVRTYLYNEPGLVASGANSNLLTGIVDESGQRFTSFQYDAQSRSIASGRAGGADHVQLTYNTDGTTSTQDALGATRSYAFQVIQNVNHVVSVSGPVCNSCGISSSLTYNTGGDILSRTDFNGNGTCYAYDAVRHLETFRVEGFAPGFSCPANLATYVPASGTQERKIAT